LTTIKSKDTIIKTPEMLKDIERFVRCGVSVANITKVVNVKYKEKGVQARYQDIYCIIK